MLRLVKKARLQFMNILANLNFRRGRCKELLKPAYLESIDGTSAISAPEGNDPDEWNKRRRAGSRGFRRPSAKTCVRLRFHVRI